MTSHMSAATAAVKHAMRKNKMSAKRRISLAKRKATNKLNGSGGSKSMLKAAANNLANHPNSKIAQQMVKRAVKMA